MSELAATYYAERGIMNMPELLQGAPRLLVSATDQPPLLQLVRMSGAENLPYVSLSGMVSARFQEEVAPVAAYAKEGVPLVLAEHGRDVSSTEWATMKDTMPHLTRYATLERFARRNAAPALVPDNLSEFGGVYTEAIALAEVPPSAFTSTMQNTGLGTFRPNPQDSKQQLAEVFLLSRTVSTDGECVNAHLTVVWGELRKPPYKNRFHLSVRYLGAALTPQEIEERPWLHQG